MNYVYYLDYREINFVELKKDSIYEWTGRKKCLGKISCGLHKLMEDFRKSNKTIRNGKEFYTKSLACKICDQMIHTAYYFQNKDRISKQKADARQEFIKNRTPEQFQKEKEQRKELREKRKDAINTKKREKRNSIDYYLYEGLSNLIRFHLKNNNISKMTTSEYIDYTVEELKQHLELQFEDWMTWKNRGNNRPGQERKWQLDHIIPLTAFIFSIDTKINLAAIKFGYSLKNSRPLDAAENNSKTDKVCHEAIQLIIEHPEIKQHLKPEYLAKVEEFVQKTHKT